MARLDLIVARRGSVGFDGGWVSFGGSWVGLAGGFVAW